MVTERYSSTKTLNKAVESCCQVSITLLFLSTSSIKSSILTEPASISSWLISLY
ncbi:Uncharacterised protein [Vibrio cholerae]|nr:Uncharacterised protein [Vibrio cholerae]